MKNFLVIKWLRNVSIAKKLYFTVGIMALLIAIELITLMFAINTLSSVRAYVGGEGLWSKAQKDAIFHLEKYGYTWKEQDYVEFQNFMKVPDGDHVARMELQKQYPNMDIARQGFIAGRNHPQDVDGMINLFRRFHDISYISKAIDIWTKADNKRIQLFPIAENLHKEISSSNPDQKKIDEYLQQINPINQQLTLLEDEFSFTLGEGSRWMENLIKKILFSIALTVEISGLLLTISVSRGIQKGLTEIIRVSKVIAKEDLSVRAKKFSKDEIGALAESFNRMADELEHNISERHKSKELLKESEERFRLIVENVNDYAIFMVDTNGCVVSWNDGAERITGYSAAEIMGKNVSVFYTEEKIKEGEPQLNLNLAREKGHFQTEGWRKRKDGPLFWAEILTTALYDDDDKLRGYAKIIRDITERKMVENALKQSQAQLSMAQQLAHIGSWEWDLVKNTLNWSDELYRIYGIERGEGDMAYERVSKLGHPADSDKLQSIIAQSRRTHKPFEFYHRIIRADNSERTLHARGEVIVNESGEAIKLIGTDQDVTDRLHKEKMDELALAATKSNNSVIIADREGKIEWVNEGFTKLTGYTLEEVVNTHGELLRQGGETGLSPDTKTFEALITRKEPVAYEGKNFTKDGHEYWVITTLTPMLGKNGQMERIVAIDSDITERKQIEEDLILANQIAENSLKKGNRALNDLMKAKKELEESLKVKEQFLAKMSHEIRTPMNAIVGLTEILLEGTVSPEQKECLEAVKLSSDNLLSIINDILDFSKLESGKLSLEMLPFNLKEVIEGVMLTLHFSAVRKGIPVEYSLQKGMPEMIVGDPVRVRQILLNLVSNSVKFTEKGSVKIEAGIIRQDENNYTIRFVVKDTGIGIPADRIQTIFESFTQASNETSRKYGGTGLGLTIVKQLAELQGGSVYVESEINKGSSFFVILPFKKYNKKDFPEIADEKLVVGEMLESVNVLLVEDNEMNQMLAQKILDKWGYEVDVAENGKVAIEKMKVNEYDIVLMDIQMPEMDGYEATKYIRTNMPPSKSRTPIIAMTAHAIMGEAEKCIALGMDDYISKPFNQKTLYEKMNRQLRKKQNEETPISFVETKNATTTDEKHIDLTYLAGIAEGNKEFMKKMINVFLQQTPKMLTDMSTYLEEKKWAELRGVAHKMKPSLDFVGIHALKNTVKNLEKYASELVHLELVPEMVEEVKKTCESAMEELKIELANFS